MALALDFSGRRSALSAALVRPRPSLDRIPRLRDFLADACEHVGDAIAAVAPNLKASLQSVDEGQVRDHLGLNWHSELCAVLTSKSPWGEVLIHFGFDSIGAITLQAMGGHMPVDSKLWPRTRLSRIETAIAKAIAEAVGEVLNRAFRNAGLSLTLELTTISDDQTAIAPARDNDTAIAARIGFEGLSVAPGMSVLLPLNLVAPFAPRLAAVPKSKPTAPGKGDAIWRRRIESELAHASVSVAAVLETREATLEVLAGLKVGDVLALDATADSHVVLESEDVPLYACELGKQDGVLTVRIDSKIGSPGPARASASKSQSAPGSGPT
jgi:flagellar motor switch protein FliM